MLEKICIHITHRYLSKMSFRILLSTAKMQIGTKYIKETLNAFTQHVGCFLFFTSSVFSLAGVYKTTGQAGESRGDSGQKWTSRERQKMAVTLHLKKAVGQGHRRQEDRSRSVTSIVVSFCWSFHIPPVVISKVISSFPRTKFVIQVFLCSFFSEK